MANDNVELTQLNNRALDNLLVTETVLSNENPLFDDQRERSTTPLLVSNPSDALSIANETIQSTVTLECFEDEHITALKKGIDSRKKLAATLLADARAATLNAQECEEIRCRKLEAFKKARDACVKATEEAKSAVFRAQLAEEQVKVEEAKLEAFVKGQQAMKNSSGQTTLSLAQPIQKIRLLKPAVWPLSSIPSGNTEQLLGAGKKREGIQPISNKRVSWEGNENQSLNGDTEGESDGENHKYWKRVLSRSQNRYYYFNTKTKETSWTPPSQLQRLGQTVRLQASIEQCTVVDENPSSTDLSSQEQLRGWEHRFSNSKQLFCYYHLDRKLAFYAADPPAKVLHSTKFAFYVANARSFTVASHKE